MDVSDMWLIDESYVLLIDTFYCLDWLQVGLINAIVEHGQNLWMNTERILLSSLIGKVLCYIFICIYTFANG